MKEGWEVSDFDTSYISKYIDLLLFVNKEPRFFFGKGSKFLILTE